MFCSQLDIKKKSAVSVFGIYEERIESIKFYLSIPQCARGQCQTFHEMYGTIM